MNRVEIVGGLTRDPEGRVTNNGQTMLLMTVAVNGTRYDSERREQVVTTTFVNCTAWGPVAAEFLGLKKGDEVYVLGRLDQHQREGKDRPSTRVAVLQMGLIREGRASRGSAHAPARHDDQPEDPWS